jgi:putative molybdopterin biosynthesis protein
VEAVVPLRIPSAPGRTEYSLVDLVDGEQGLAAYPLGAGSGSVTAFARADGFVRIPDTTEYLEEGSRVTVRLIQGEARPADLVAIGSHCIGLDHLLGLLAGRGFRVKSIPVGSTGGLHALRRGEGDVAGIHLLDPETDEYNRAFLPPGARLLKGYGRRQGIVSRPGTLPEAEDAAGFVAAAVETGLRMVNRNPGSGTRILIDGMLGDARPEGYLNQARTHHAVAAAVEQGRSDWGMTLDTIAAAAGLEFRFVGDEEYDLAILEDRWERPAVQALCELLEDPAVRSELEALGFRVAQPR